MGNPSFRHKGIYKQQLMREVKKPSNEAKERAEDWLFDNEILRVFVDASELNYQGIFGLGVCFVGQGETILRSKKHYNQLMKKRNTYAELVAVDFALDLLPSVLSKKFTIPSEIVVYSDWNEIKKLEETYEISKNETINKAAGRVNEKKLLFSKSHSAIYLEISYLNKELKKWNPYYRASHNAAQRVVR